MIHDKLFDNYKQIILEINEEGYYSTESGLSSYKACLLLLGNYTLRIKEIWDQNSLLKYSYYWLDDNHNLIIGWDNAPHHIHVKSFPHHKHIEEQSNICSSEIKNLTDALQKIQEKYKGI